MFGLQGQSQVQLNLVIVCGGGSVNWQTSIDQIKSDEGAIIRDTGFALRFCSD